MIEALNLAASRMIPQVNEIVSIQLGPMLKTLNESIVNLPDMKKISEHLNYVFKSAMPPNWPEGQVDLDKVEKVVIEDGIPLVWIPRPELVELILQAPDKAARFRILAEHKKGIVEDCLACMALVTDPMFSGQVPLGIKAIEAFSSGRFEAAQALSTVVAESAIRKLTSESYRKISEYARESFFDEPISHLRMSAALAPVGVFYTPYFESDGKPPPEQLSRHMTVHFADVSHYTELNAILSIMLLASVLRGLQEMQEVASQSEA